MQTYLKVYPLVFLLAQLHARNQQAKRDYYTENRSRILEQNRACKRRRGHLWKRKPRKRWADYKLDHAVRCFDCGALVYRSATKPRPRRSKSKQRIRYCQDCWEVAPTQDHLFLYSDYLAPASCEPPDEPDLTAFMDTLDDRLRKVVISRLWDRKKFSEIGRDFNVTRSCAQNYFNKAIRLLRHPARLRVLSLVVDLSRSPDAEMINCHTVIQKLRASGVLSGPVLYEHPVEAINRARREAEDAAGKKRNAKNPRPRPRTESGTLSADGNLISGLFSTLNANRDESFQRLTPPPTHLGLHNLSQPCKTQLASGWSAHLE